jgi:hypothetical protein
MAADLLKTQMENMTTLDLITKQDLEQFKMELFAELKKLSISPAIEQSSKQWLKSADVRRLLKISPGTLQNLRINGTLSYTTVGSILYYKYEDILKVLEGNTINK